MTFSELKLWFTLIYEHIANQNGVRFSVVSYFTKFAVENVHKAFVYITDLTCTLTCLRLISLGSLSGKLFRKLEGRFAS